MMKTVKKRYIKPKLTICTCGTGKPVQDVSLGTTSKKSGNAWDDAVAKKQTIVGTESLWDDDDVDIESPWEEGDGDVLSDVLE